MDAHHAEISDEFLQREFKSDLVFFYPFRETQYFTGILKKYIKLRVAKKVFTKNAVLLHFMKNKTILLNERRSRKREEEKCLMDKGFSSVILDVK